MSHDLDPAFAAEAALHESYGVDWISDPPEKLRSAYDAARSRLASDVAADCTITPVAGTAGTCEGLLFKPAGAAPDVAIVYFHGGSWVVGSPDTHRVPCSHLSAVSRIPVISVRYGLAPENPFPAQREDGVRAVEAVLDAGAGDLPPPRKVVIAGDSAGAAVAFWTEAALPEQPRARVVGVVGFYGGYGLLPPDNNGGDDGEGLSTEALLATYRRLGPLDHLEAAERFSIVDAVPANGPPCYLGCGTADALLHNTQALAERLEHIGRPVTLDLVPRLGHSFLHYVARVPAARDALGRSALWIAEKLSDA